MNFSPTELALHRERLVTQIALQRQELGQAFHDLETPIHYAEVGLRGFSFFKKYPWLTMLAPAAFSLVLSGVGRLTKRKLPKPQPSTQYQVLEGGKEKKKHTALIWLGLGLRLYTFYRRLRPFFL